jgi:hypothetical protein
MTDHPKSLDEALQDHDISLALTPGTVPKRSRMGLIAMGALGLYFMVTALKDPILDPADGDAWGVEREGFTPGDTYEQTARTTALRVRDRISYDRRAVHAVLDEAHLCHLGFTVDGQPRIVVALSGHPAAQGDRLAIEHALCLGAVVIPEEADMHRSAL